MNERILAGQLYRVKYPFTRCVVDVPDDDPEGVGYASIDSWTPGVRFETVGPIGDDSEAVADGEGYMLLTVVDTHKPGRFPARVFYTRSWETPDGRPFGKGGLHIMTQQAFRRRATGYMHEYRLQAEEVPA